MNPLQQCSNSSNGSPNSCSRSTSAHTTHGISQELVSKFQSFRGVSERGVTRKVGMGGVGAVLVFAKPFQIVQIVQICRTCFFPRTPLMARVRVSRFSSPWFPYLYTWETSVSCSSSRYLLCVPNPPSLSFLPLISIYPTSSSERSLG